jgi:hypothetical protein
MKHKCFTSDCGYTSLIDSLHHLYFYMIKRKKREYPENRQLARSRTGAQQSETNRTRHATHALQVCRGEYVRLVLITKSVKEARPHRNKEKNAMEKWMRLLQAVPSLIDLFVGLAWLQILQINLLLWSPTACSLPLPPMLPTRCAPEKGQEH